MEERSSDCSFLSHAAVLHHALLVMLFQAMHACLSSHAVHPQHPPPPPQRPSFLSAVSIPGQAADVCCVQFIKSSERITGSNLESLNRPTKLDWRIRQTFPRSMHFLLCDYSPTHHIIAPPTSCRRCTRRLLYLLL